MINTNLEVGTWFKYEKGNPASYPPAYGTYLVYRAKCGKWHKEVWNGSGWAYNNNDITHFTIIILPTL
jgi:hypothetical protein